MNAYNSIVVDIRGLSKDTAKRVCKELDALVQYRADMGLPPASRELLYESQFRPLMNEAIKRRRPIVWRKSEQPLVLTFGGVPIETRPDNTSKPLKQPKGAPKPKKKKPPKVRAVSPQASLF